MSTENVATFSFGQITTRCGRTLPDWSHMPMAELLAGFDALYDWAAANVQDEAQRETLHNEIFNAFVYARESVRQAHRAHVE